MSRSDGASGVRGVLQGVLGVGVALAILVTWRLYLGVCLAAAFGLRSVARRIGRVGSILIATVAAAFASLFGGLAAISGMVADETTMEWVDALNSAALTATWLEVVARVAEGRRLSWGRALRNGVCVSALLVGTIAVLWLVGGGTITIGQMAENGGAVRRYAEPIDGRRELALTAALALWSFTLASSAPWLRDETSA